MDETNQIVRWSNVLILHGAAGPGGRCVEIFTSP